MSKSSVRVFVNFWKILASVYHSARRMGLSFVYFLLICHLSSTFVVLSLFFLLLDAEGWEVPWVSCYQIPHDVDIKVGLRAWTYT